MKIYIIGPSCVGKTTLADELSEKLHLKHFDLDRVFIDIDYIRVHRKFKFYPPEVYNQKIKEILASGDDWIVEGVYPVSDFFEAADVVLYLRKFVLIPIVFQWRRYFTDLSQRKNFGLLNNFGLTMDIIRQYLSPCLKVDEDPMKFSIRKYQKVLQKYSDKVYDINSDKEASFSNLSQRIEVK